jgi:hypothetical protein
MAPPLTYILPHILRQIALKKEGRLSAHFI